MTRYLRLRWPQLETTVRIALLDDLNAELAEALWTAAPFASIQTHATVAGQQIYCPTRLILPHPEAAYREPMNEQRAGRVNFEPFFQYAAINYGPMTEPVAAWPVAQVVEADLPQLPALGRRVWDNLTGAQTPLPVLFEREDRAPLTIDDESLSRPHAALMPAADVAWRGLLAHIEAETDAIWLRIPEDVLALSSGIMASDAGVYGQYFSPWVMVTGLIRGLAVAELAALVRLMDNERFAVYHLATMLREMLTIGVGVVGYFGLPQLGATLEATQRVVTQIEDRDDFRRFLTALFTYVNRYNLWLHETFPWKLAALYPKTTAEKVEAARELLAKSRYHKQ